MKKEDTESLSKDLSKFTAGALLVLASLLTFLWAGTSEHNGVFMSYLAYSGAVFVYAKWKGSKASWWDFPEQVAYAPFIVPLSLIQLVCFGNPIITYGELQGLTSDLRVLLDKL